MYSSFSTVTTAKWLSPAHTCWALLPPLNMSIFCGVNLPPPQKYTSRERVVTTAMGVSVTVLSLWVQRVGGGSETQRNPPEKSFKKETCVWSYFGFFMAEFNRATRSSSSLTEWCQWRELLVHFFLFFLEKFFLFQSTHCLQEERIGWSRICSVVGLFAGSFMIQDTHREQWHGMTLFNCASSRKATAQHWLFPHSLDRGTRTQAWSTQTNKHRSLLPWSSCPGLFSRRGSEGSARQKQKY